MTSVAVWLYFILTVLLAVGAVVLVAKAWMGSGESLTLYSVPVLIAVFAIVLPFIWTVIGWLVPPPKKHNPLSD